MTGRQRSRGFIKVALSAFVSRCHCGSKQIIHVPSKVISSSHKMLHVPVQNVAWTVYMRHRNVCDTNATTGN